MKALLLFLCGVTAVALALSSVPCVSGIVMPIIMPADDMFATQQAAAAYQQLQQQQQQQLFAPYQAYQTYPTGLSSPQPTFGAQQQQQQLAPQGDMCEQIASGQLSLSSLLGCAQTPFNTAAAFTVPEAAAAKKSGWSLQWVSQEDGSSLIDPLEELAHLQQPAHTHPAPPAKVHHHYDVIIVDVDDNQPPFGADAISGPFDDDDDSDVNATSSSNATTAQSAASLNGLEYSWRAQFDQIFDAEHSAFEEAGSGWNDEAIEVRTDLGPCRGQNQPGHLIYCATPGSRIELLVAARNTGTKPWTPGATGVRLAMHELDAAVWADPYVTPMDLDADFFRTSSASSEPERGSTAFFTASAATAAYGHALSTTQAMELTGLECIVPNATGIFSLAMGTPSDTGLYALRFSPTSPCGRLARPIRLNIEITCSDGIFCNGFEMLVDGVCQKPLANKVAACDDKDACTIDACNEQLGACSYMLLNTTECRSSVCGGARCTRSCAVDAQCGADGCGGVCGLCQAGESCTMDHKCVSAASTASSCFTPQVLEVFKTNAQAEAWKKAPETFSRGSLDMSPISVSFPAQPSELSRQFLRIGNINEGGDEVSPSCVSFGTRPDFIWKFVIPPNAAVGGPQAQALDPLQVNTDPLGVAALKRNGFVGLVVQAYGKYDPRIDTVVEIRGAPGVFASKADADATMDSFKVGSLNPVFTCMEDRRKLNGTKLDTRDGERTFLLATSELERARSWALGDDQSAAYSPSGLNPHPLKPFTMCNDNGTPPGGLGSQVSVLLPPGTYYMIVSSYPRFNIPTEVQTILDSAVAPPVPDIAPDKAGEVEAFVRFTSGYLPECGNQACGNDGGSNDCGAGCAAGSTCHEVAGKCAPIVCKPDCAGRTCGSDGCGGVCGRCSLEGLSTSARDSTSNPLGVPFAEEDVYCVEARDPSLDMSGPDDDKPILLGAASCALMPRTCDGARPVCYGMPAASSQSGAASGQGSIGSHGFGRGCPVSTFCANDCRCRALGAPLPDLLVKFDALMGQISLSSFAFSNRSCSLVEQCIQRPGVRKLLRFSVAIINQGQLDLNLPKPRDQPDDFLYSPCHHHFHYHHFADYSLIADGKVRQRGHKQAFCLEDSMQEMIGSNVPCLAHHTCSLPGIQRGWSDYYGADLDCQWVDVSDLAPGKYLLRVEVNSARSLLESNFENNVLTVEVNIPK